MKKRRFWSASLSLILILALCLGLSACGQSGGDTASTEGRTDLVYCLGGDIICRYVIQQDINKIALDLREAHKDDFFSVPEDNPLEDFLQTAEETASPDNDPEQAAMGCKKYAFENLNRDKVCSVIKADNLASIKVAESIGMSKEDEFTTQYYNGDMLHFLYSVHK